MRFMAKATFHKLQNFTRSQGRQTVSICRGEAKGQRGKGEIAYMGVWLRLSFIKSKIDRVSVVGRGSGFARQKGGVGGSPGRKTIGGAGGGARGAER